MNSYQTILLSKEKYFLTIWLNRPDVHNAMNEVMIAELTEVYEKVDADKDIRTVLLRGKGKSFCAGADLNYMKGIAHYGLDDNEKDGKKLASLYKRIYECRVPTIALVHGAAFGGANGLLAACDIVIAEENTTFAFSEVKLGIAPATILPFVIRRIGEFGAKELMMTGKRFKAREAEKWHLVNHVVNADDMDGTLEQMKAQFLSSAPVAVRQTKEMIGKVLHKEIDEVIDYTSKKIAELRASDEGQEGMASFLEKRKPKWTD